MPKEGKENHVRKSHNILNLCTILVPFVFGDTASIRAASESNFEPNEGDFEKVGDLLMTAEIAEGLRAGTWEKSDDCLMLMGAVAGLVGVGRSETWSDEQQSIHPLNKHLKISKHYMSYCRTSTTWWDPFLWPEWWLWVWLCAAEDVEWLVWWEISRVSKASPARKSPSSSNWAAARLASSESAAEEDRGLKFGLGDFSICQILVEHT